MNKILVIGRLSKDVELKVSSAGKSYAKSTIAVNRDLDKSKTDFIPFTCFGKTAETLEKYVKKGNLVGLEGSIQLEPYEKDGVKRTFTSIMVTRIELLPNGNGNSNSNHEEKESSHSHSVNSGNHSSNTAVIDDDDDFPF